MLLLTNSFLSDAALLSQHTQPYASYWQFLCHHVVEASAMDILQHMRASLDAHLQEKFLRAVRTVQRTIDLYG